MKYCEQVYERNCKTLLWTIKYSGEILNKVNSKDFLASSVAIYYLSTLLKTLPRTLIEEKLTILIEQF